MRKIQQVSKFDNNRETPNFRLDQPYVQHEIAMNNVITEDTQEYRLEDSQSNLGQESVHSNSKSLAGSNSYKYSRRLDELKRQQAKLEKIKNEKEELNAFLEYQAEIEKEKHRREQEALADQLKFYNDKATTIQKYARVWLAKRYVSRLQEIEYQKQKALLSQALEEMTDHIRVVGTESKDRFVRAAIIIQKFARGMFIRKLLSPYFELLRSVNPIVNALSKAHKNIR